VRRKIMLILVALLALVVDAAAQDLVGTLVVANRIGGSVSLVDLPTGVEIARVPVGARIPHEVAVSPDGRRAITGAYGSGSDPGRHVVVIDIEYASIAGRIDLGPDSRPHSLAFLPDGRRAVVTMELSDRLALVDTASLDVLRVYATGGREGHMVRLNADGTRAYVASRGAEGTLSVIYLEEDRPPTVVATGAGAEGLAVAPDGDIWVVNRRAETLSVVDGESHVVKATLPARLGAGRAEISGEGRVLVPNGTGADALPKYFTLYDAETRTKIREREMNDGEPGSGAYSIHIVGEQAFVADRAETSISIYDLNDLRRTRVIKERHDGPDGLAYSPLRVRVMREQ
jgi:DNA-binding beta-propeller fold protein YncE